MYKTVKSNITLIVLVLMTFSVVNAQDEGENDIPNIRIDARGIPMVYVPSGEFEMGVQLDEAVELCQQLALTEEYPPCNPDFVSTIRQEVSNVSMEAFYIDQFEVSRSAYIACVEADVCSDAPLMRQPLEPSDIPVQYATYYDAAIYCAWRESRVPTHSEWEYATRGSYSTTFPWGNVFDGNITNHCDVNCLVSEGASALSIWDDGFIELAPIDAFDEDISWISAYNLAGNILEWTSTRSALNQSVLDDLRVIKGGSYDSYPYHTAGWYMSSHNSVQGRANIGFRCVRTTEL